MARGGKRPGAGRPKGSKNPDTKVKEQALSAALNAALSDKDLSPLDFMLALMRDPLQPLKMRFDAAKAAAPFRHASLASLKAEVDNKVTVQKKVYQFPDADRAPAPVGPATPST